MPLLLNRKIHEIFREYNFQKCWNSSSEDVHLTFFSNGIFVMIPFKLKMVTKPVTEVSF